jgi:hypothetical protein
MRWPAPRLIGFRPLPVLTMELFTKLFGNLLAFVYHCFDRPHNPIPREFAGPSLLAMVLASKFLLHLLMLLFLDRILSNSKASRSDSSNALHASSAVWTTGSP